MSGKPYNAQKGRTKYNMPLWWDSFLRDTALLETDEIGAYLLILGAMWSRESCDIPADPRRLSRAAKVSLRLWNSRISGAVVPFLEERDGMLISTRLRREAQKVEAYLKRQADRKAGDEPDASPGSAAYAKPTVTQFQSHYSEINSEKSFDNNEWDASTDMTTDISTEHPTQEPKNPSIGVGGGGGSAKSQFSNSVPQIGALLQAMGRPTDSQTTPSERLEVTQWSNDLGLTIEQQCDVISATASGKRGGPPKSLRYFTKAMQRFAGDLARPPLLPDNGGNDDQNPNDQDRSRPHPDRSRRGASDRMLRGFLSAADQYEGAAGDDD